jgi:hypothetical protein
MPYDPIKTFGLVPDQVLVSLRCNEAGAVIESPPEGQTVLPLVKFDKPATSAGIDYKPKLVWFEDRVERQWQVSASPAPHVVPFRALAFALLEAGLYEQVKAAALSTPQGEIWWSTAQSTTVQRDHPFVAALATAVSQTPEQIDVIFAAAASTQF